MIIAIRKQKRAVRIIATFMVLNLLVELVAPLRAFALTGGPSQPEVQAFEPVSANQMVDPFTGDFTYNIPLLDVGGYPINISYHAGPSLDEEASWVGLGWNINPGVINRNMRGIPDDFFSPNADIDNGANDYIKRRSKMKPSRTFGIDYSPSNEIFSKKTGKSLTLGIEYNNYKGFGYDVHYGKASTFPFSVNFSSQNGLGVNINFKKVMSEKCKDVHYEGNDQYGYTETEHTSLSGSIGVSFNSRQGISKMSFGLEKTRSKTYEIFRSHDNSVTRGVFSSKTSNGSSEISFLNSSYIPSTDDKNYYFSINASVELGKEFFGLNPDSRIGVTYSQSGKFDKDWEKKYPVYGYLNHSQVYQNFEHSVDDNYRGRAIMDFNSYGRNMLTKSEVELPYNTLTYDVLAVTGQGMSGVYRAHQAAVGAIYDQNAESISIPPINAGVDLGVASTAKFGIDLGFNYFKSKSGRWEENNALFGNLSYAATRGGADFEQVYFKNAGEKTSVDRTYFDAVDWGIAARPEMEKDFLNIKLKNNLKTWATNPTVTTPIIRNKRDKRNQVISILSANDAEDFGLIKYRSLYAKDHHIGQVTAVNPDGSRYIYAQPAYNTVQKEFSFSFDDRVGGRTVDGTTGIAWFVNYLSTKDNTSDNDLTLEQFFDYEETPAYAHSFLLNAVVSPDYMDLTDNGPSPDDNGSYTNIKYKKLTNLYKWRTPYASSYLGKYPANHQEGLYCDQEDDKASFIYGEKEIFYVEKIETKTHVALFFTSDRKDGLGVSDELGTPNTTNKLQKLDSIQLFTTYEYNNYSTTRKPIKVVYFQYDYSLCPGIPNNSDNIADPDNPVGGKLTLTKIWFKYGNSKVGELSPYQFYYTNNFNYGYKNYDRWGNYKATPGSGEPRNDEFPYTPQNKTNEDTYAAAWSMNRITLPSGGEIVIEYEADDYAYVQDKKAMEMFKIASVGTSSAFSSGFTLYGADGTPQKDFIYFDLKVANDTIDKYLPEKSSIDNERYLYINAYVKLKSAGSGIYDYVRCYAKIESAGICSDGVHGYIQIKKLPLNEAIGISYGNVNPISKTAWQFMRLNAPHLVHDGQDAFRDKGHNGISINDVLKTGYALLSIIPEVGRMIGGFNTEQIIRGRAQEIDLTKSWIRLQSPEQKKLGGGYRVKKIFINNNWDDIVTSEESQTMGQIYDYFVYDEATKKNISSGVASYEPQLGGDENPYRLPSFYTMKKLASFGAEDYFYNDVPLGESVYPSPMVGYRQIRVRNLKPSEDNDANTTGNVTRHGTGYTLQKFYTAYDFPVIATKTNVDADFKKSPILALLSFSTEVAGATQGFAIELNDMHGKPKAMETYDEYGKLITKTEYNYKVSSTNSKQLSNNVTTLKKDGTIDRDAIVGYEVETVLHPKQLKESGISVDIHTDADVFFLGVVPVFTPGFGLGIKGNYKLVRTASITKMINRYGILESITVTDQSSSVSTKNVAFDDETGEVLLTETTNEFNNKVYNFSYPSHWAYDRMGPAYQNIGAFFNSVTVSSGSGKASFSASNAVFLVPGDELIADNGTTRTLVWVLDKEFNTPNYDVSFIDRDGVKIANGTYSMRIIRSGKRNMQTIPVGKIVSNDNPVPTSGGSFLDGSGEVLMSAPLNASAASFSDQWQDYRHDPGCWKIDCDQPLFTRYFPPFSNPGAFCFSNYADRFHKENDVINPFVSGIRGNWRPDYTYVYYDRDNSTYQRTQTAASYTPPDYGAKYNKTNISTDGKLNTFKPFWYYNSNRWKNRGISYAGGGNNPWTWNSKANQINPDGVELENKNALDIYSSAQYSFISKQPLAVTYNAKARETLYEGFEDYPVINYTVLECNIPALPTEITQRTSSFTSDNEASNLITTPTQWYFWPALHNRVASPAKRAILSSNEAHTGKNSLEVTNSFIKVPTQVYDKTAATYNTGSQPSDGTLLGTYHIDAVDLTDIFSPSPGAPGSGRPEEYLLTYWVKATDLTQASITVKLNNTTVTATLSSESPNIEGWIKREYILDLTGTTIATSDIFDIIITNTASTNAFFDDIRIHPIDANMKSFVYDNKKLRLMATLDENNYATFFEYDEEGNLVRTKRETERGIITISENRQNIKH